MKNLPFNDPALFEALSKANTLGQSIRLCAEFGDFALDKDLQQLLNVDKSQFSRWSSGEEGIKWPKFVALMDECGNDAPVLWMLRQRGYDLNSVRKLESETEKVNRQLREENAALRRVLQGHSAAA